MVVRFPQCFGTGSHIVREVAINRLRKTVADGIAGVGNRPHGVQWQECCRRRGELGRRACRHVRHLAGLMDRRVLPS